MKKLLSVFVLAALAAVACTQNSPTSPDVPPVVSAPEPSSPITPITPVTVTPTTPPVPSSNYEGGITATYADVKNNTPQPAFARVLVFKQNADGSQVKFVELPPVTLPRGGASRISLEFRTQGCPLQLDLLVGPMPFEAPASLPAGFPAGTVLLAFDFRNQGGACTPTPEPTPSPTPTPQPSPTPTPTSCVNPPTIIGEPHLELGRTVWAWDRGTITMRGQFVNIELPASGDRPLPGQPDLTLTTTFHHPFGVETDEPPCIVTKTFTVRIPAQVPDPEPSPTPTPTPTPSPTPACSTIPNPTITLTPNVITTPTTVTVDFVTATPAGGILQPTPPQTAGRPAFGQPGLSIVFLYTIDKDPSPQYCPVMQQLTVPVPPRDAPPAPTCGERVRAAITGPGPVCVVLNGGQSSECAEVAQAFASPVGSLTGLTFTGTEAQINATWTWSQNATFAFVVDANECQGQPKAVRIKVDVTQGEAVPFNNADVDGGSATYCNCPIN